MTGFERFRKKGLLTRAWLADYMGVSKTAVGKWENGQGLPSVLNLVKLSNLYGVTINELLRTDYHEIDLPMQAYEEDSGCHQPDS